MAFDFLESVSEPKWEKIIVLRWRDIVRCTQRAIKKDPEKARKKIQGKLPMLE